MKAIWADPISGPERRVAIAAGAWKRDYASISEKVKAAWTPEKRAARAEAMRKIRAEKKWKSR